MATYPGMTLGGEVRESISLDEDDLSDVEDEVFIRDGKNSYKLAEELNVKRPLMAPRRKLGKPDITTRLKARPPCRAFWKPCCYIFAALVVLIGLIALVVILVSIFPLPLDKFRDWIITRSHPKRPPLRLLPCSSIKVEDVWSVNLPTLNTDSPIRLLDVNRDSVEDAIFGFGTGDNYGILPPDLFCSLFLGVAPPCEGGVAALDGVTGAIIWRHWANDSFFALQCTADLNGDGANDCLAMGVRGTILALDSKNGSVIWRRNGGRADILVANFIPDQNNDSISDILSSQAPLGQGQAQLVMFSGKDGSEITHVNMPDGVKTFFMPQILKENGNLLVIFGTGSLNSPGNLNIISMENILNKNFSIKTIYENPFTGVLTQTVLVDITGDKIPDIIIALYNSTLVAIDGSTFTQIWHYTIPSSQTNIIPTPGYFNDDNVTDFLITYQGYDNILNYNYTKTFIIDGKTGKPVYDKPIFGSITTQMGGLTLAMESYGYDTFLFWTSECISLDNNRNSDSLKEDDFERMANICQQQPNTTKIIKLNALNQNNQPPGFTVYTSVNRSSQELDNFQPIMKQVKQYFENHPKLTHLVNQGQAEIDDNFGEDNGNIRIHKYGSSSFRHKDNKQGIVKDYDNNGRSPDEIEPIKYDPDYDWRGANMENMLPGEGPDFSNYNIEDIDTNLFNQKQQLIDEIDEMGNRDPRSREELETTTESAVKTKKKNLSENGYGVYDYKNIRMARNRLLHDLNNSPTQILQDTYLKNKESELRKSRFEQRDIGVHRDKLKENQEMNKMLQNVKDNLGKNASFNLWDLESEKETQDRKDGYLREKRQVILANGERRISSVAALTSSSNNTNNFIDIIFIVYWQPFKRSSEDILTQEMDDCIKDKLSKDKAHSYAKTTENEQRVLYARECQNEQENFKSDFPYISELYQLSLGQMTVYKIRIECQCNLVTMGERCAKILPIEEQNWASFMGKLGDGYFPTRN